MAYEIRDRLSLQIFFGDSEFPFARVNSLDFLHMSTATSVAVPILHFAVVDQMGFLTGNRALADGMPIQVRVQGRSSSASNTKTYKFRLNSFARTISPSGIRYEIDAYLDTVRYWHASSTRSFKGSSYSAIENIAKFSSLQFKGDVTSDTQVWFPTNLKNHEWARRIAERGYRSDGSCMQLALNLDGTLVYRDMTSNLASDTSFSFMEARPGFSIATDFSPSSQAGSLNNMSGYSDMVVEQVPLTGADTKVTKDMTIRKNADERSLLLSSNIHQEVTSARVRVAPISPGNVHDNYEIALYQNTRMANLFSVNCTLVTPEPTQVNVLDTTEVFVDESNSFLKAFSGKFRVIGKAIYVQSSDYYERFELCRRTLNQALPNSL